MAQSPDHPELKFVQAAGFTRGRPDGNPLWIVIHDMEAGENSARAESTAAYFANPGDGRSVSAHYCVDNDSVIQCVKLADVAWTVGNTPGNNRGINWELAGFARQTKEEWLDAFGIAMFTQMAKYVQRDAVTYKIPLEKRSVSELKAFKPGITSHNDLRLAFGKTTHTDPGPNFPWAEFMDIIRKDEDNMTPENWLQMMSVDDAIPTPYNWPNPENKGIAMKTALNHLVKRSEEEKAWRAEQTAKFDALVAAFTAITSGGTSVDTTAVIAKIDEVGSALGAKIAEVEAENDGLRARLSAAFAEGQN